MVACWVLMLVLLVGVTKKAGKSYADGFSLPGTDSAHAQQLLARGGKGAGSGDDTIVIHADGANRLVTDPAIEADVQQALAKAARRCRSVGGSIRGPFAARRSGASQPRQANGLRRQSASPSLTRA